MIVKKKLYSLTLILAVILLAAFSFTKLKAASGSTKFNIKQTTNLITLKKQNEIGLEISYSANTQKFFEFEINLLYEASKFEIKEFTEAPGLIIYQATDEVISVGDNCYVQFRGYSKTPIDATSGKLFDVKLTSTYGASNTSIVLAVVQTVVHNTDSVSKVEYGKNLVGSSTVSFSETLIPWWIWLVLGAVIVIALVGGYIFHLLAPKFLGVAANKTKELSLQVGKKTKELSLQVAAKTKQLTNQLFNRKPVAPKMKPSNPQAASTPNNGKTIVKPVTSTAKVIKPLSSTSKSDSDEKK
jgi:hypothetical protein